MFFLIHIYFHPSMFLSIYTFTLPCSYPYIYFHPSMFLSIYTFTLPCSIPYILSPFHPLIHTSFHPSMFLSIYPFTLPCSYPYILSPFHPFTLLYFHPYSLIHPSFYSSASSYVCSDYFYSDLARLLLFRPCVPMVIQTLRAYYYSDLA